MKNNCWRCLLCIFTQSWVPCLAAPLHLLPPGFQNERWTRRWIHEKPQTFPQKSETHPSFPEKWNRCRFVTQSPVSWNCTVSWSRKLTQYLQVFDLQSVHVQVDDVTGRSEAVIGLNEVTELGLGEELLLCQRPAGSETHSTVEKLVYRHRG